MDSHAGEMQRKCVGGQGEVMRRIVAATTNGHGQE